MCEAELIECVGDLLLLQQHGELGACGFKHVVRAHICNALPAPATCAPTDAAKTPTTQAATAAAQHAEERAEAEVAGAATPAAGGFAAAAAKVAEEAEEAEVAGVVAMEDANGDDFLGSSRSVREY